MTSCSPLSAWQRLFFWSKGRLPASAYEELTKSLDDPDFVLEEAPFTSDVVDKMRQVPRAEIPHMPDRIVAATALYLGVPVISRDGRIRGSNVQTVW